MSLINRPVKIDAKRWTSSSRPHQPLLSSLLCPKRPSSLLSAETLGSSQQPTSRGLFLEPPQCTLSCVDPCGLSHGFPLCPAPPCPQRMFTWHCSIGVGSCLYIVEHCDFKEEGFRQERMISKGSPVRTGQGIFKPNFLKSSHVKWFLVNSILQKFENRPCDPRGNWLNRRRGKRRDREESRTKQWGDLESCQETEGLEMGSGFPYIIGNPGQLVPHTLKAHAKGWTPEK